MALQKMFSPDNKKDQLLLAVRLTDQTIQTVLWQISQGKIHTIELSSIHLYTGDDQCVVQTDEALQELGKQSEGVDKVLFGVEPKWINGAGVVDAKKPLLEKLTKQLSLDPVGYVCVPEAISKQFSIDEPLFSALMLEVSDQWLRLSLVQRGQLGSYQEVGRSDDLVADTREALARVEQDIGQDHLPPKIIVFSDHNLTEDKLQELKQNLMDFDFVSSHPFLSPPMIEINTGNLSLEAMIAQGGASIATSMGIDLLSPDEVVESEDFGFSDLTFEDQQELEPENDNLTAVDADLASSFGLASAPTLPELETSEAEKLPSNLAKKKKKKNKFLDKIKSFFKLPKKKKTAIDKDEHKKKKSSTDLSRKPFIIAGFVGGIIVLIIIGLVAMFTSTQAVVKLKLKTQTISQDTRLTLDPEASAPDAEEKLLPAKLVSKSVSSGRTTETTGVKLIGDNAKGTVIIYNKTDGEKTFESGTVLSSGNLTFTLDDNITVASASSTTESTIHGKAEVNVTAQDIGADSNLGKDSELTVADFSDSSYVAKVKDGLTGGSSREVRVVSEDDLYSLRMDLISQLLEIADQEFKDEEGNGTYYITTNDYSIEDTNYDAEEGDEVETVTLDLSISVEALSYQVDDLKPLAEDLLKSEVPDGYKMVNSDPQILSSPIGEEEADDQILLEAQISNQVEPVIDYEALKSELVKKKLSEAESYLNSRSDISTFVINLTPKLVGRVFKMMPRNEGNISFDNLE